MRENDTLLEEEEASQQRQRVQTLGSQHQQHNIVR